jgi:transcriptional regulator with XRE-family HTH domain
MSKLCKVGANIFGRRLREQRLALGLSQEALGVVIGIDESSSRGRISRYELGINEPAVAISRLLAKALNVPVGYFYCDDDLEAEALQIIHRVGEADKRRIVETLRGCLPEKD